MIKRLKNYRLFFQYFKKYRNFYLLGIASLVVVDVLEIVPPLLLKWAVDSVSEGTADAQLLALISGLYMLTALVQGLMRYFWRRYISRTSMLAAHDLRDSLFYKLTTLSPAYFKKSRTGELVSLATNDVESVRFAMGPGALTLFDAIFYFITIPPMMFYLSPELTLVTFIPLIFIPQVVRVMEAKIHGSFTKTQAKLSELSAHCQEALAGIRLVKGNALEGAKERSFGQLGHQYREAAYRSATDQSLLNACLEFAASMSVAVVLVVGGSFVIGGTLSIGVFVAFQRYVQKLTWPMEAIGLAAGIFQRSLASQERLENVYHREEGLKDSQDARSLVLAAPPKIELKNFSFRYPDAEQPVLSGLSLVLEPGEKIGLMGPVGSGKSTLLHCLAGLEKIPPGTIFWNGIDATSIKLTDIRAATALVPQDVFLFSETIAANLLYGSQEFFAMPEAESRRRLVEETLETACISEEIAQLPLKADSLLGERGHTLSGGQRQRLTIARALARRPKLLLLDDCLSAVDAATEHRLVERLNRDLRDCTVIVSSHRPAIMRFMDKLWILEKGQVVSVTSKAQIPQTLEARFSL